MSKVKVVGNAVVITSDLKAEELKNVKKFTKDGLKLKDAKGNEIFSISCKPNTESSISEYGICYGEVNAEGYAQATLLIDETVNAEKRVDVILDNYAIAIGNLNALESYIRETIVELSATIEGIKESIEVID